MARTPVRLVDTPVAYFDVVELLTLPDDRCVDVFSVDAADLRLLEPDGDLRVMASSCKAMRVLELFELQSKRAVPGLLPKRQSRREQGAGPGQRSLVPVRPHARS